MTVVESVRRRPLVTRRSAVAWIVSLVDWFSAADCWRPWNVRGASRTAQEDDERVCGTLERGGELTGPVFGNTVGTCVFSAVTGARMGGDGNSLVFRFGVSGEVYAF